MKRIDLLFAALLVPLDYITLLGAAAAAYTVRYSASVRELRPILFDLPFEGYIRVAALLALVWIVIFAFSGLYAVRAHRIASEIGRVILACSTGIAAILAISFFSRELFDSRFIVLAVWGLSILFIVLERLLIRGVQRSLRVYEIGTQHVVMIGKTHSGNTLHEYFDTHPRAGYTVTAHFARFSKETKKQILALKKKGAADAIMAANPDMPIRELDEIKTFTDVEHLQFLYSAEMFPSSAVQPIIHTLAGQPIIEVPKTPLDGWGAIYKRGFDFVFALLLIILTLPIQLIVALALFVEQPGSVLFIHKRVGRGGKKYKHIKFRSMVKDAHKHRFDPEFIKRHGNKREGTPLFKLERDPRVTRVGAFIRKLSLDELPEFYLVLFGHMSLVGPRPHLPEEVNSYKPEQKRVMTIRPGISGMAQTSGRADLTFDEEVRLDMYYIENWSPWLDLIILAKTPIVVLFSRGAY